MPSAGEPFATSVIRMCRASAVDRLSLNIHPRLPVAPRFQSWLAPAGIGSPLSKSGLVLVAFFRAASHGEMRAAARETAIRTIAGLCLIFRVNV